MSLTVKVLAGYLARTKTKAGEISTEWLEDSASARLEGGGHIRARQTPDEGIVIEIRKKVTAPWVRVGGNA